MTKPTALYPLTLPLNRVCLVEASAGTGKTYTMVSLYLRLLLQAGENGFSRALSVDQILVVTFTEAATEELKKNIRERISQAKRVLNAYRQQPDPALLQESPFLAELLPYIGDLDLAVKRLSAAEQNMDMAAVYTIHGFCRRILMEYAFNSGVHFNLSLSKDESALNLKLANEYWRKHYYGLSLPAAEFIHKYLGSPQQVLNKLKGYLGGEALKLPQNRPHLLQLSPTEFIHTAIDGLAAKVEALKSQWREQGEAVNALIREELAKKYPSKTPKRLKRTSFKANSVPNWLATMADWAASSESAPPEYIKYFSQHNLNTLYVEDGAQPLSHPLFAQVDDLLAQQAEKPLYAQILYWHYLQGLRASLADYKLNHQSKNFDDLLMILHRALSQPQGEDLAAQIRQRYPFAMIDEFQDTDFIQYQIFAAIYQQESPQERGFIMIGDPKQAIYKFRGADIFSYLYAVQQAQWRFNLGTNWRSAASLVNCVNRLFDFPDHNAFLYEDIQFHPVAAARKLSFHRDGKLQPPWICYLDESGESAFAEACAVSVQHWLAESAEGRALLDDKPIEGKNIAVLVRDRYQAAEIKQALMKLGIASVYLSDDQNVFKSEDAWELSLILTACLHPFQEKSVLNAIAGGLFALTSAEIQRIKQHENTWELWVARFAKYQRVWQYQGVLAMLHQLLLQEGIVEKLLAQANGERRLTDLLHLAELLQQAAALNENEAALLRWYERQLKDSENQDERRIRLESEQDLVKIVSYHKSKGLEYDLVWLPFMGQSMRQPNEIISTYHHEGERVWDIRHEQSEAVLKEAMAEEIRLLYVALTRAKYQIVMSLPAQFQQKNHKWSALLYTLTQGAIGTQYDLAQDIDTQTALRESLGLGEEAVLDLAALQPLAWSPNNSRSRLAPRYFQGKIESHWQISSFTALSRQHERLKYQFTAQSAVENPIVFYDDARDHDLHYGGKEEALSVAPARIGLYAEGYSPFDFPQGAQIGVVLHDYFEHCDFRQPVDSAALEEMCRRLGLDTPWAPALQQWLQHILHTPLDDSGLCLAAIRPEDCLREMQFYLKLTQDFDLPQFNRLLAQYHIARDPFLFEPLKGMVRGFMDLVFRHGGKYYIVDYKSNYLGSSPQDYAQSALTPYMIGKNYDLQYLLYTLALHRYLSSRVADYNYKRDFGGVIYTFLRGMNGENTETGIYRDKPAYELICALDRLF